MNKKIKSVDSFSKKVYKKKSLSKSRNVEYIDRDSKFNIDDGFSGGNYVRKHSVDAVVFRKKTSSLVNDRDYLDLDNDKKDNESTEVKKILNFGKFSWGIAMVFVMVVMGFVYKNFGQTAEASSDKIEISKEKKQQKQENIDKNVLNDKTQKQDKQNKENETKEVTYGKIPLPNDNKTQQQLEFEKKAKEMVKGYPIEKMLPYIFNQDIEVASYLIAIAKQESNWGKRKPVLNGKDCYNYWGYRAKREKMGSGGHTCFSSREDAVNTVGKRIHKLVYDYNKKTAKDMIIWKCGKSCSGHSSEGVNRWINTVSTYKKSLLDK